MCNSCYSLINRGASSWRSPNSVHMPRTKNFNEEEVLEKAVAIFWKQGYHATSMQDLVEHLGINRASLYGTFGDKWSLFRQSLKHYQAVNAKAVKDLLYAHSSPKEGFKALFTMAMTDGEVNQTQNGCFMVNTTTELIPGNEEIKEILANSQAKFKSIFHDYIQYCIDQNALSDEKDVSALSAVLFTYYNGLRVVLKVDKNPKEQSKILDTLLEIFD